MSPKADHSLRVGLPSYILAEPYARAFPQALRKPPAELAQLAARGELDLVLTSSLAVIELGLFPHPLYGIGCSGEVMSVLLVGAPPEECERLVLDPASRTSNELARLVVQRLRGSLPPTSHRPAGRPIDPAPGEAWVVIGDPALALAGELPRYDLGRLWKELTGQGFIFALFGLRDAGHLEEVSRSIAESLENAEEEGFATPAELLMDRVGLSGEVARRYFTQCLDYRLTAHHWAGLELFLELRASLGSFPLAAP